MSVKKVFECRQCGTCCRGRGGIYLTFDRAKEAAALLGLSVEEFSARFTEPQYGLLSIKTDAEGYCLMLDRETGLCRIHQAKPPMCRDWPFFHGLLQDRQVFEEAKAACPGIDPESSWEEFKAWHKEKIGKMPPQNYF